MRTPSAAPRVPPRTTAALIAGAVLVVAALLLSPLPLEVRAATSAVALVVLGVALASGAYRNARHCHGRRRQAWLLFTWAAVAALLGNGWSLVFVADPVSDPSVVTECFVALGQVLSIGALIVLHVPHARGPEKALLVLDGFVAGSAALLVTTITVYSQVLDSLDGSRLHQLLVLAFPFLDVVIVTMAALLIGESRSHRVLLSLIGGGFMLYALSDLVFTVRTAQGISSFGGPFDLGWIAGYGLLVAAVLHPDARREPDHDRAPRSGVTRTALVFALLVAAVTAEILAPAGIGLTGVRNVLWIALVVAVGARQALLTADNAALRAGLERRVAEQTADLRRMARETEALLSSAADGIYGVDRDGLLTFANPAAAALLGYDVEELLGKDPHATFHAPQPGGRPFPREDCYLTQAIELGLTASSEADSYVRADGTDFAVEVTASPLRGDDGVQGAVVAFRDITQRNEVDRMKNEFLSVVSHELRTPLTSIRGSLGLLTEGSLGEVNPVAQRMLSIALESSERLSRLINDILDIERIESGRLPMSLVPHDTAVLVDRCLREMSGMAQAAGVTAYAGDVSGWVLADDDRVVQALTNLIGNAVKFSPSGSVVVVEAAPDPGLPGSPTVFSVTDHGRGIPADRLEAIFQPFEQVDSSDTRQHGGTGLGLAITRRIVEAHGGRVWAESTPGVGTTMRFTLPSASAPPVLTATGPASDAPLVLVCDDDVPTVAAFTSILDSAGYRAHGVSSAEDALVVARERRPDAVLVDVVMPETSGDALVGRLKADERTSSIPIVVISGLGPRASPQLAAQAAEWLVKPLSDRELVDTVAAVLASQPQRPSVLVVEDDADLSAVLTTLLAGDGLRVSAAATVASATAHLARELPDVLVLDLELPDGSGLEVLAALEVREQPGATTVLVYTGSEVEPELADRLGQVGAIVLAKGSVHPEEFEARVLRLVDAVARHPTRGSR